ncbi:MAG: tail fiber domain-containing protein [Synechococcales cyanobacterium M58_A2018_015]|nr:tail fiber domain-containing protein [Synechococcales cyanobacterium M58_A2018_015]
MVQGPTDLEQAAPNDLTVEGDVVVRNGRRTRIRLDRETGSIFAHNNEGQIVFQWEMPGNNLRFGGIGNANSNADADLVMFKGNVANLQDVNQATFHVNTSAGSVRIGGNATAGQSVWLDANNNQTAFISGANADLILGGRGTSGSIFLRGTADSPQNRIRLDAENANIWIGGFDRDGDISIFASSTTNPSDPSQASIRLNGDTGAFTLGGNGTNGVIALRSSDTRDRIRLDANTGGIRSGGHERNGFLAIFPASATEFGDPSQAPIFLNGETGNIQVSGVRFGDGTLQTTAQLRGPEGERGPQGPQGPQGEPGPPGIVDFTTTQARVWQAADVNRAIQMINADGTVVQSLPIDGQVSDQALKTNFQAINSLRVLEKLSTLRINQWNWKNEDPSVVHIGPTSQDFLAAFGLGSDERQIKHVDMHGVTLASIQALHHLFVEQHSQIKQQQEKIESLEAQLENLRRR